MARSRKRRSGAALLTPWLLWGGLALLVFKGFGTTPAALGLQQQPMDWWFNPLTLELRFAPGLTPPAGNFRPASAWEQLAYAL
jgi:hypothetical protein